jgi:hypothetical protein
LCESPHRPRKSLGGVGAKLGLRNGDKGAGAGGSNAERWVFLSFNCVCGHPLVPTQYYAPNGNVYDNYVCPACHRYFKSAKIKHLRLFSTFSIKIKNSVVLFDTTIAYFPEQNIIIRKVDEKHFTISVSRSDEHFLYPFKTNPPFPLSMLK